MTLQEERREWETLINSPAWERLKKIAEGQINTREKEIIYGPPMKVEDVPAREYMRGELGGIALFLRIPEVEVENLNIDIEKEQENDRRD